MKLLNKISRDYVINTSLLFVVGLFVIYFAVNWVISSRTNEQLRDTTKEVTFQLEHGIKQEYPPLIQIREVNIPKQENEFKDTTIYSQSEQESIVYRQYIVYKTINGQTYSIVTRTSLIEKEDLFSAILIILVAILSALLLILFFSNRITAKKILLPFEVNLKRLENFSLNRNTNLILEKSDIEEFNNLNKALSELSEKALSEYRSLKEFSEDLSHELQTPVAVIKNKIELLLQEEYRDNSVIDNLQSVYNNIDRLDKLNRVLVLLTRLESKDLFPATKILLDERINRLVNNYGDIAYGRNITTDLDLQHGFEIKFNDNLLDILLSNLFSNSIKHNRDGGKIFIKLSGSELIIKNTGREPKLNLENYFNRFAVEVKSPNSLGLGLSIVKKICDLYGLQIKYIYENPFHEITINFKP